MKKILIPAAKVVPEELQRIGKLPAIIYPINKKIVFDFLYEQYQEIASSFDVICYEKAENVHQIMENYKDEKIVVKDLEILGDLGNTIYFGLENESTVIINFSDTIVFDNIYEETADCYFYAEDFVSERWTFFEEVDGVITQIYDKNMLSSASKGKLFVGVFQICDSICFKRCLEKAFLLKLNNISTFFYALMEYSKIHPMKAIKTDNWFDIGHLDKYYDSLLAVKAREFNQIKIDKNRAILRKTSEEKDKFIGEILWYLKLPTDIEYVRPRIFSYSIEYANPYVEMEYYSYHTLHELFLYGELSQNQWRSILQCIHLMCKDFGRYQVYGDRIKEALEEVYLNKTIYRIEKLKEQDDFKNFINRKIKINGIMYKSLDEIMRVLRDIIPKTLYDVDVFQIIHGDLCFSNILIDNTFSFIKVVDPRGKFGGYDIYGDFRYELAKLFHSVDGKYDYIIKDLFEISIDTENTEINYVIREHNWGFDVYELLINEFKDDINNIKEIELIEALLFLSMIPLHCESKKHQFAMLATGIQILNRVVDIKG